MMYVLLLLLCVSLLISTTVDARSFRPCIETLFNLTQSCQNDNVQYSSTMGFGSGLGSEFNSWLMRAVLNAFFSNRRFIYLITKRTWEYDCPAKQGWACYLKFSTCSDSIAEPKDIKFMKERNPKDAWHAPGPAFVDREHVNALDFSPQSCKNSLMGLKTIYNNSIPYGICDFDKDELPVAADFAGVMSNHIFHYNTNTVAAVRTINHHYYEHLGHQPFASLMIRLTDKRYETKKEDWEKLINMQYVTNHFLEALHNHTSPRGMTIHNVYIATDNCTAAGEVLAILAPKGFKLFGACFLPNGKGIIEEKLKSDWNPRKSQKGQEEEMTHLVLADIAMLRKGSMFMGMIQSNLARMIHYLRYPLYENTYSMLPQYADISKANRYF